jgi:hypothetical protein
MNRRNFAMLALVLSGTPVIFVWMKTDEAYSLHFYISIWLCKIFRTRPFIRAGDGEGKVESTRCLINWAPHHKDVRGIVGGPIPIPFLNSAIDGLFTLWLFYHWGNRPQYSLCRRFSGPHSLPGRYGEHTNVLSVAGLESRFLGWRQQGTLMLKLIFKGNVTAVDRSVLLLRMGLHEVPVSLPCGFVLFLNLDISLLSAR